MLFKNALGQTIREIRMDKKMTLRDVSANSYIAISFLSEVERGKKEMGSICLTRVAEAMGLEPYELILEAGYRMAGHSIPDTAEQFDEYADLVLR